jgi:hypothetical protein
VWQPHMPPISSGGGQMKGMALPVTLAPDVLAGQRPLVLDGPTAAILLGWDATHFDRFNHFVVENRYIM